MSPGPQGLQLLWLVALSCRTPAGGSSLLADNAKAYFKRAKAHAAVWNEREAREDFQRVAHLDPSMAAAVKKELKQLGERMRKKHVEDRKRYQGLFQSSQGLKAREWRRMLTSEGLRCVWNSFLLDAYKQVSTRGWGRWGWGGRAGMSILLVGGEGKGMTV